VSSWQCSTRTPIDDAYEAECTRGRHDFLLLPRAALPVALTDPATATRLGGHVFPFLPIPIPIPISTELPLHRRVRLSMAELRHTHTTHRRTPPPSIMRHLTHP